jgi:hypothetical protein
MKQFNIGDKLQYESYTGTYDEYLYIGEHISDTDTHYHQLVKIGNMWKTELVGESYENRITLIGSAHYITPAKFHKHDFAIETNAQDIMVIILDERDDHDLTYRVFDTLNACIRTTPESALKAV